jgi:hypothetical protein
MATDGTLALTRALQRILRPLVHLLLKSGVSFLEFVDIAKRLYVELAMREMQIPGRKASVSRAAVLTGLSRKEVQKVLNQPPLDQPGADEHYNRAARVISGWVRDVEFRGEDGRPAALPISGEDGSFAVLVRRFSGDIPPRAILDELVRVGSVEVDAQGRVRLLSPAYVPREASAKIDILGTDVGFLVDTVQHNLEAPAPASRYQRKVMYDNLPDAAVTELRPQVAERCQALLAEIDQLYSQHDRDSNPQVTSSGRRQAGIGIYYFERELKHDEP